MTDYIDLTSEKISGLWRAEYIGQGNVETAVVWYRVSGDVRDPTTIVYTETEEAARRAVPGKVLFGPVGHPERLDEKPTGALRWRVRGADAAILEQEIAVGWGRRGMGIGLPGVPDLWTKEWRAVPTFDAKAKASAPQDADLQTERS